MRKKNIKDHWKIKIIKIKNIKENDIKKKGNWVKKLLKKENIKIRRYWEKKILK